MIHPVVVTIYARLALLNDKLSLPISATLRLPECAFTDAAQCEICQDILEAGKCGEYAPHPAWAVTHYKDVTQSERPRKKVHYHY